MGEIKAVNTRTTAREKNIWFWIVIFLILVMPILSIGDDVGLYFDAVFPDYTATQILNPQTYQERWFAAYPILCQIYHGSVGVLITLLSILLTGKTSVLQHNIVNSLIIFMALMVIDNLLMNFGVKQKIRYLGITIFAFLPTIMTFSMTQYYIELPGVVMLFLAVAFFEKGWAYKDNSRINFYFLVAFWLLGVAFYSYYNFLFFFPGFLALLFFKPGSITEKIKNILIACYSMGCGASLYFAGYAMIYVNSMGNSTYQAKAAIIITALIYIVSFIVIRLLTNQKIRASVITSFCVGGVIITFLLKIYPVIVPTLENLNVGGTEAGLTERVQLVFRYVYYAVSGVAAENNIYKETVTQYQEIYLIIFCIITLLYIVKSIATKKMQLIDLRIWKYLAVLLVYLVCCIFFATRMQTQHFVPIAFWLFMILLMEINVLISGVRIQGYLLNIAGWIIAAGLLLFTCFNRYKVVDNIIYTGGIHYYSNQINALAYDAIENANCGKKEIYIFPEWGFMSGFNYLTNNRIAFSVRTDEHSLNQYIEEGFDLVFTYWDEDDRDDYLNLIERVECKEIIESKYVQNNGEVAFYKISAVNREY